MQKKAKLSFHIYYAGAIIALVGLLLAEDSLSRFDIVDLPDIFLQITAVVLGATIAAWLTTTTYDYISRSTQEREWSRSIHLRTWEDIYRPIYEDVVNYSEMVKTFRHAEWKVWTPAYFTPKETILGIINANYLDHVRGHKKLLDRYNDAWSKFDSAIYGLAESYYTDLFPGKSVGEFVGILRGEGRFLVGIHTVMTEWNRKRYAEAYRTYAKDFPDLKEDLGTALDAVKSRVQGLAETKEFLSAQSALKKDIETLIGLTEEAIKKPYEIAGREA